MIILQGAGPISGAKWVPLMALPTLSVSACFEQSNECKHKLGESPCEMIKNS
jgi:hypothetical protein